MTKSSVASAVLALVLLGCGQPDNQVTPVAPDEEPAPAVGPPAVSTGDQPAVAPVKLANPASTNCIERGGKLEMHTEPAGQFGVCIFDDGSRCEEWAYFRGECKPGECTEPTGKCE